MGNFLRTVTGILVLATLLGLVSLLGWAILVALTSINATVAAAIVAGSATVLVSVLSVILSKQWERRREIEQEHRKQKIPIYKEFLAFWFKVAAAQKPGATPVTDEETVQFMRDFTQKLMFWGSDGVIREYAIFKRQMNNALDAPLDAVMGLEKVLLAMRADTGHRNKGLAPGDLMSLVVNDLDAHLPTNGKVQAKRPVGK
jgi:hypothetical protein